LVRKNCNLGGLLTSIDYFMTGSDIQWINNKTTVRY